MEEAITLTSPETKYCLQKRQKKKKKKYRVGFSKSSFHVIERGIKIYQTKLCISWLRLKGAHRLLKTFLQPSLLLRSTDFQNRFLNSGLHVLAPFITCIFNIPGDTLITTLCFNCYQHLDYMVILQPKVNIKLLSLPAEE